MKSVREQYAKEIADGTIEVRESADGRRVSVALLVPLTIEAIERGWKRDQRAQRRRRTR